MRCIGLALGLILLLSTPLIALEVEDHRFFPGSGQQVLRVVSRRILWFSSPTSNSFRHSIHR